MSEFKQTGNLYVSQWNGNSLNAGTAIAPYAHPADIPNIAGAYTATCIVGTGYYTGNITRAYPLYGDGEVVIDVLGLNYFPPLPNGGGQALPLLRNIRIKNGGQLGCAGNNSRFFASDCYFEYDSINFIGNGNGLGFFYRCILKGAGSNPIVNVSSNRSTFCSNCIIASDSSVFLAGADGNTNQWQATLCYFPKGTTHTFVATTSGTLASFTNNCVNGIFNLGGTNYELKRLIDGTPRPDADPLIADLNTAPFCADVYTRGNFASVIIGYIDIEKRLVSADSDLLKKVNSLGFIGGFKPAKNIPVNSSDPNIEITTTSINTSDSVNWLIQSPNTEGFINIIWKISENITELQKISLDAVLTYDGSKVAGGALNNNVPDIFPASYSPLSNVGLKPNRLTYELRTSQSISKPTIDAEWDNDAASIGSTVPGTFYVQEWNTKPTILTAIGVAYGNGNPSGIGGVSNGINARWGHAKIRLTNNRSF